MLLHGQASIASMGPEKVTHVLAGTLSVSNMSCPGFVQFYLKRPETPFVGFIFLLDYSRGSLLSRRSFHFELKMVGLIGWDGADGGNKVGTFVRRHNRAV